MYKYCLYAYKCLIALFLLLCNIFCFYFTAFIHAWIVSVKDTGTVFCFVQNIYAVDLFVYSKVTEMHSVHNVGLNDVKMTLKLTNEIDPSSPICMQLYNIIFKRYSYLSLQTLWCYPNNTLVHNSIHYYRFVTFWWWCFGTMSVLALQSIL